MSCKLKILVIEDDALQAMLMVETLSHVGCEVLAVRTGKRGMELARENKFDLIALDVGLPDINGFEMCRELKQRHVSRHTPVVLVSGNSSEEHWQRGLQAGATDFISKPFNAASFTSRILSHVKTETIPA